MGKADDLFKKSILPAAEAGLNLAKERMNQGDLPKTVADAVKLSQTAMENSKLAAGAAVAALSQGKEHLTHVDVPAGIADAVESSREVVAATRTTSEKAGAPPKGNLLSQAGEWAKENPVLAVCAGAGALGVGIVAAPGLVTGPLLASVGFCPGVGAGSLAAAAQSFIGNVAAGSAFAMFQSAGAGGAGLAIVNGVVQGAGVTVAGGAAGVAGAKVAMSGGTQDSSEQRVKEEKENKHEKKPHNTRSKL